MIRIIKLVIISLLSLSSVAKADEPAPVVISLEGEVNLPKLIGIAQRMAVGDGAVHLFINSPGGDFIAAKRFTVFMSALKKKGRLTHCYGGNLVASAAFYIFLHCDSRKVLPSTQLFPHKIHLVFYQPVLPGLLLEEAQLVVNEQAAWDKEAQLITGMSEDDYLRFRDSDNKFWTIPEVMEASKKDWFTLVPYYLFKVVY